MTPPDELIRVLGDLRQPVIGGHINPDVDAMGSMLALARALPSRGAIALPRGHVGKKVAFLRQLAPEVPVADADRQAAADAFVVLDTATTSRININGTWEAIADRFVINIDHHITNADYGRINWIVDDASSTSEMVFHLIRAAGWPIDGATASLLYAGLYADTAGFSLPSATPQAFEAAAALVRLGADIERVGTYLCRSQHLSEFELLRRVYHNTRLVENGTISYSTLTYEEITSSGCTPEDIDDQVSIPRSLSGIRIAMLFSEIEPGVIRINLRGENGTPVLPIAVKLGGGGHRFSAGVRIRGPIASIVERVIAEAVAYLAAPESA
ncbi:MAG TPA: bifunctional oligoribonuclease/PAP phosphatase NrnA [Phycisphaerae bacterium]|nr:bifunctional oligoribonuclease/PAP phosphatase NrnA [Phycisphaerae bacterium]